MVYFGFQKKTVPKAKEKVRVIEITDIDDVHKRYEGWSPAFGVSGSVELSEIDRYRLLNIESAVSTTLSVMSTRGYRIDCLVKSVLIVSHSRRSVVLSSKTQ